MLDQLWFSMTMRNTVGSREGKIVVVVRGLIRFAIAAVQTSVSLMMVPIAGQPPGLPVGPMALPSSAVSHAARLPGLVTSFARQPSSARALLPDALAPTEAHVPPDVSACS